MSFFCGWAICVASAEEALPAEWVAEKIESAGDLIRIQERVKELLPKVMPSLVGLGQRGGAGSGVMVSPEGLILTAGHVTMDAGLTLDVTLADGSKAKAATLGASYFTDAGMARLIDPPGNLPSAEIAPDGSAQVGDWCFALGHPGGMDEARGPVLRIGRIISRRSDAIRTDCVLVGGDSGGPLFDMQGRVIAIHSRISRLPDDNYHVPIEAFHKNWEAMLAGQILRPGGSFLGVMMEEHEKGVRVSGVVQGSAAERAGIRPGDIITHFNDLVVTDPPDLRMAIGGYTGNEAVKLELLRSGEARQVEAKLGNWRDLGRNPPEEEKP